jgi:hypothetical protein
MTTRQALDDTINGDLATMDPATLRGFHVVVTHVDEIRVSMKKSSDRLIGAVVAGNLALIVTAIVTSIKLS